MKSPLYIIEQGAKVTRKSRRIVVSKGGDAKERKIIQQVPVLQVSQIIVFGNIHFTTPVLRLLLNEGVEVVLLNESGKFQGRLIGAPTGNGSLRVGQVLCSRDGNFAQSTAQQMVYGKIHNMRIFLQRYARRFDEPALNDAADLMRESLSRVQRTQTINSLMGVEGRATAIYFGVWKHLLKPPWTFNKRVRRPPTDPVNVLLSFGYTILLQNMIGAVLTTGMDPYVGFLHQLNYNRPSLALDLLEEFRPLIVDSVVLRCLNNEIITQAHFVEGNPEETPGDLPLRLTPEGIRIFIRELETRLGQSFKHPVKGEQVTYRKLFIMQAYNLVNTLDPSNTVNFYKPFLVR